MKQLENATFRLGNNGGRGRIYWARTMIFFPAATRSSAAFRIAWTSSSIVFVGGRASSPHVGRRGQTDSKLAERREDWKSDHAAGRK